MHMTGWLWSSALPYWRHRQTINVYHVETVQVSWSCIQIPAMIFRVCSSYSLAARGALSRQFHGNTIIRESVKKDKVREMGQKVRYYSCCCTTSWHFTRSISKWVKAWLQLSRKEKRQPTQQKRNWVWVYFKIWSICITFICIEEGQNYVEKKAGDVREIVRSMKISHEFP